MPRVVSLIPSGTEWIAGLLEDRAQLRAVTHECDEPAWVRTIPKVVHPADPALIDMPPDQVDKLVSASIHGGESLYVLDEVILQNAAPDVIVTQRLCDVCTVSSAQVQRSIHALAHPPIVLELAPMTLADVIEDAIRVGGVVGRTEKAEEWQQQLLARLQRIRQLLPLDPKPRVLALEWPDPLWTGGHWIPEMIEVAGGISLFGAIGEPSTRADWQSVKDSAPDVIVMMACGYDVERNVHSARQFLSSLAWRELPALQNGNVFAVDANSYFSRSGPRLIDGCELLSQIFRNEPTAPNACRRVSF